MANVSSWRDVTMTVNGVDVDNWSQDSSITFEKFSMLSESWGRDGGLYVMDNARQGGTVDISVLPTSQFAATCLRWYALRNRGEFVEFQASYRDERNNTGMEMSGGFMMSCDPAIIPGKDFEVTFMFEVFTPDSDGANFSPPPLPIARGARAPAPANVPVIT